MEDIIFYQTHTHEIMKFHYTHLPLEMLQTHRWTLQFQIYSKASTGEYLPSTFLRWSMPLATLQTDTCDSIVYRDYYIVRLQKDDLLGFRLSPCNMNDNSCPVQYFFEDGRQRNGVFYRGF